MLTNVFSAGGERLPFAALPLHPLIYRHHTNPVGTEWKWQMDDPDVIFQGALENHTNLIKQFRGKSLGGLTVWC